MAVYSPAWRPATKWWLWRESLYGDFVDITAYTGENPDLKKMMENTRREMEKGTPVICEASFDTDGLYCAVDILRKDGDGWAMYEVKSSSKHGGDF